MQHDMVQFSVMDFHAHNSFMPCHVPSAEVNSAIQKYCQKVHLLLMVTKSYLPMKLLFSHLKQKEHKNTVL